MKCFVYNKKKKKKKKSMITKKTVDEENDKQSTDTNKMMYLQLKQIFYFTFLIL